MYFQLSDATPPGAGGEPSSPIRRHIGADAAARKFVAKPIWRAYHGAMKRAVILFLIMVWVLAALGGAQALADANSLANRLVVEAVGLLHQARAEPDPERQFELITKVEANLNRVIDRYPGSNAAVKLATGQGIGILSLELVASEKAQYEALTIAARGAAQAEREADACFAAPSRICLLAQALAAARNMSDADKRESALYHIVKVQAESGNLEEALITADEISDDLYHKWAN